jgi:hypothetical protein
MQILFGTLSLRGLTSLLMPGQRWLLMVGFPDPQQAGVAATNFIVNVRHLQDNTAVAVTGTPSSIGTQPVIVMSDINAAGPLMEHAVAAAAAPPQAASDQAPPQQGTAARGTQARSSRSRSSKAPGAQEKT